MIFLFPLLKRKSVFLYARFFCIVANEWDFHGVQGFLYLILECCANCSVQEVEKNERNACMPEPLAHVTKEKRCFHM